MLKFTKPKYPFLKYAVLFGVNNIIFIACFWCITMFTLVINNQFDIFSYEEKKGILSSELYNLNVIPNGNVTEFEFTNISYLNKNSLHCKVKNLKANFDIAEMLKNNNWSAKDYYYVKDNIALVVKEAENENTVTLDMYIY